ncbi:MAG: tol-pal system-associated acyl-CoA thioesterase [Betaproteobacteria bacterium]
MPSETFRFPVRVYYEDTDAAGVVYYANYLKFMERARTEWLAAKGFEIAALEREHGIAFVVRHANVDWLRPARLGDRLDVTFALVNARRASLVADQEIRRGDEVLARARITVACLDHANWRPARIPAALVPHMENDA